MRRKLWHAFGFYFTLIAAAVSGCAVQTAPVRGADATYSGTTPPEVPAEIKTSDDAKQDLAALIGEPGHKFRLVFRNEFLIRHNLQQMMATDAGRNELMRDAVALYKSREYSGPPYSPTYEVAVVTPTFSVSGLGIRWSRHLFLPYSDLPELPVRVDNKTVLLGRQVAIEFDNSEDAQRASNDLSFMRAKLVRQAAQRAADFEARAAKYREMAVKPAMSEEQRKYVVQANAMRQRKKYVEAIDLYLKAINVDPVSYPDAYFDLALLSAQLHRYTTAMSYMKQYLDLVPDGKDARSAQDKIYEWEILKTD